MVSVKAAAKLISKGKVVAYPTETAYGLAAKAFDASSVKLIYDLKGRPTSKKMPILIYSLDQLKGHVYLNDLGRYLSNHLHPGPLNITVNSHHPWVGAFRISSSKTANELVKLTGPITATSANFSGESEVFNSSKIKIDVPVVSEKRLKKRKTSTIYDPVKLLLIREGDISIEKINQYVVAYNVLQKIRPSSKKTREVVRVANEVLKKVKITHKKTVIGGSVAKLTFTKSASDIDIFLLFKKGTNLDEKLDYLKDIAKFGSKTHTNFAQHPYVKTTYKGYEVELVPAYETTPPEVLSAADRSRWHVKFVKDFSKELRDEVLILKQFFRGIGTYGADSKVEGFSAYAMEVLIHKYGNFVKVLEWLVKTKSPLNLKDPVDKKRNVLASVSIESLKVTKLAANDYLTQAGENFFFPEIPKPLKTVPKSGLALIKFERPYDLVEDAVWGNTRSKLKKIVRNAKGEGFEILKWSIHVDKSVYGLLKYKADKELIRRGPPKSKRADVKKFKETNEWFEENKKLFSRKKKRFSGIKKFINHFETGEVFTRDSLTKTYKKFSRSEKIWIRRFLENLQPWEF
ncbi:MAG: hypothetical protein GOU98_03445 [Candidatus Altiarchaeota archaeon]|nr:hypothetical protein [Candidatus Altiarchaeota archaeon]